MLESEISNEFGCSHTLHIKLGVLIQSYRYSYFCMVRIGIIFGGPSREREISFASGRTVYDNLNKSLFEAVPLFLDSNLNLIELDWPYIYKGTIRDFYPPQQYAPKSSQGFQCYIESLGSLTSDERNNIIEGVGKPVSWDSLPDLIDFAFLTLHGSFGEDGQIQGRLDQMNVPYSGSGINACAIGMDKAFQKKLMQKAGFPAPEVVPINHTDWTTSKEEEWFLQSKEKIGWPMVIRPSNQGSSIGVKIIDQEVGFEGFKEAVDGAFFKKKLTKSTWESHSEESRINFIQDTVDIRVGVGLPLRIKETRYHLPDTLLEELNKWPATWGDSIDLIGDQSESDVLVESFIKGKEFSCIVIKSENNDSIALPPTEIVKGGEVYDYRSKYLAGLSRKITPIDLPTGQIQAIRKACETLFEFFQFDVYARIDGFINGEGIIYLNDPNTTSGMLPSSFFFHQAAEIGLNPSNFLTYIVRTSLQDRLRSAVNFSNVGALIQKLDEELERAQQNENDKKKIAVFMGGYSFERHISVESGRNIYEKLASSNSYDPVPIFVAKDGDGHKLYKIPVNLLLKDNADDIRDKIDVQTSHEVIEVIKTECADITSKYTSSTPIFYAAETTYETLAQEVDGVFIALHGRPGEDGTVQKELERVGLAYNGSPPASSQITINKFETLQVLKENGFVVTNQKLVHKSDFGKNQDEFLDSIENDFTYPFIAKPVDDGCSSAVKRIMNRDEMLAYSTLIFRTSEDLPEAERLKLNLKPKEEFPLKEEILIEELINANGAAHFLEITGGLLTHASADQSIEFELFEPSEALASGEILSLEEKFLAGEGQNITPARFATSTIAYGQVAEVVKSDLERAAKLLGVQGYARIDAFVRIYDPENIETIIIEVNSLPGMTPATCIFHQTAINGYKPFDFIDKILEFGFHERTKRNMAVS